MSDTLAARAERALQKAFGGRVTSRQRSASENTAVGGAAHSWHLKQGGALDFVPTNGMGSITKAQIKAVLDAEGIPVSELLGPGDKGHSDHFHLGGFGAPPRARQAATGSTFDRIKARRSVNKEPSIAELYTAYRTGKMPKQGRARFEQDVKEGRIFLPEFRSIIPERKTVDPTIIDAYNRGDMPAEGMATLEQDVKSGAVLLPQGIKLAPAKPRTVAENLGLGVRAIGQSISDVAGIVANPLNAVLDSTGIPQAIMGRPIGSDLSGAAGEALTSAGLPAPRNQSEQLNNTIIRGMGGAALAAGASGLAAPLASGATQAALTELAASPIKQIISGATAGAGGFYGEKYGGTVGGIAGALAGGVAGFAGASGAQSLGRRVRPGAATAEAESALAAKVTESLPAESMIDEAGVLTQDGREVAMRLGVEPAKIERAYAVNDNAYRGSRRVAGINDNVTAEVPQRIGPAPVLEKPLQDAPVRPPVSGGGGERPPVNPNFAEAQAEGVQLTRGQAEQSFQAQNDEASLRASASREGDIAREFYQGQQDQIKSAVDRFQTGFGDAALTAEDRGTIVKEALSDLRDNGAQGVRTLYKLAAEKSGDATPLDANGILDAADSLILETPMDQGAKDALERALAKYGIIGKAQETSGRYATVVTDDGRNIRILGKVEPLSLQNAEEFRQALNAAWDQKGLMGRAIAALDDTVEQAIEAGANSARPAAFRQARDAAREQKQTFGSKDIVSQLIDWKNGTGSRSIVLPAKAIDKIFASGPENLTNLKKIKALLLSKGTPESRQAWMAIQAQGVADIFGKAVNVQTGELSGARLNTAIKAFGEPKLKVLLPESDFNQLMKLRRIIRNATVPLSGTTNPSGTAYKVINFLRQGVMRFTGPVGEGASALVAKARDLAVTKRTLEGVTNYDGANSAVMDSQARQFVADFINSAKAGEFMPATIQIGGANGQQPD